MSVSAGSMVSGLVGEMSFQALPSISPPVTLLLTATAMLVTALRLLLTPIISPLNNLIEI